MHFALVILLILFSSSCSPDFDKSNQIFEKKYREEIEKISKERKPEQTSQKETMFSIPPTQEEVREELANKTEYYPYADIAQLGDAPRADNLPNREVYEQGKNNSPSQSVPKSIFEISYNLNLHPPFRKVGAEFDGIDIPQNDAFGVRTALSEKNYLIAGSNSLKRSVDSINSQKNDSNIEVTKMLVAEKKKLQKSEKRNQILDVQNQEIASIGTIKNEQLTNVKNAPKDQPRNLVNKVSDLIRNETKNISSLGQK